MNKFYEIMRKSNMNISNEMNYFQDDILRLYRLFEKYLIEDDNESNLTDSDKFQTIFSKINSAMSTLPTIRDDTLRYNTIKYLNRNPKKLKESYEKISEKEFTIKDYKYSFSQPSLVKLVTIEGLNSLRTVKSECEEMLRNYYSEQKNIDNIDVFKLLPRRKLKTNSKNFSEREGTKRLNELMYGTEFEQLQAVLKRYEKDLEKELKEYYIQSMEVLGEQFESFNLIENHYEIQKNLFNKLNLPDLIYSLSENQENKICIKNVFNREFLEKLDNNRLSALKAFWTNRLVKDMNSINRAFFLINSMNLWDDLKSCKTEDDVKSVLANIDMDYLEKSYSKMKFLEEILREIFDKEMKKISNNKSTIDEQEEKNNVKKLKIEDLLEEFDPECEIRTEYEKMYIGANLYEDCCNYSQLFNTQFNLYHIKDDNIISMLSIVYSNEFFKNWGIIIEQGKNLSKSNKILIGIDVECLNMPLRLHVSRSLIKDFLDINQNTSLIPIYEGASDFEYRGRLISTQVLMPILDSDIKNISNLSSKNTNEELNHFVSHVEFLANYSKYPEHLKEEKKVSKKMQRAGKIKKAIPKRKYYDLNSGKIFIIDKDGVKQEVENLSGEER